MPTLNRFRLLFVDDDADACEMLALLMSSCGIDATCAQSVAQAWQLIREHHFDLFVLDGWLPGIDGFEFCRQIRAVDADTPILFYSGAAYEKDRLMGIAAGANAYVAKPDVEGLINAIKDLMAEINVHQVDSRVGVKDLPTLQVRFADGFFSDENSGRSRSGVKGGHAGHHVTETETGLS